MAAQELPRVLVVEDEPLLCEMLVEALTEQGFKVRAAGSVDDALRHLARGEPCDVLFTDVNLGDALDGAALSRAARLLRPGLPVIYASGAVGGLGELQAVPGACFVRKPYDPARVGAMLLRIAAPAAAALTPVPSASRSG
jgi:two-component system cell cycle sensor histidine kinase/response regulator CckA